ncbi:MAG: alpha-1,2-fucosyltransferase [Rhizobiaceae bacterium]|nr:alpha-1,2-fucosyltransferase [Rhizobiaceae bacterium]
MKTAAKAVNEGTTGRDKVVAHIFGGLGNQMFQYACARAIALRNDADIVLDQREFFAGAGQKPGLHHLSVVSTALPERKLPPRKTQWIRYLIWRNFKLSPRMVRQQGNHFNPDIMTVGGNLWLHGYWQSERYFADFEEQIRCELSVRTQPSAKNEQLLAEIAGLPAVSLHIRRGDYVNNPQANAAHGICTLEYYRSAALLISERMAEKPIFYVFSDEPEWARTNLDLPFEIRVMDHNDGDHNYEDLRLMAACRHHVIANSTFSWWGAWLNPSLEKIVIAPKQWFADPSLKNPDILPPSWITLDK